MQLKQAMKPKSQKSSTQKVYFEYYAPSAQSVCLTGTFNQWNQETGSLKKEKDGRWTTRLELAPGRYEYLFVVDGSWQCDPQSKECVPNPFGSWNCVLNVG
ncbi:MAG: glycoside hydrolase [Candidatus Omnitrophica bacterium]|nr:glycoside hydrolase [Candidatus Omnitrophota bacterium]